MVKKKGPECVRWGSRRGAGAGDTRRDQTSRVGPEPDPEPDPRSAPDPTQIQPRSNPDPTQIHPCPSDCLVNPAVSRQGAWYLDAPVPFRLSRESRQDPPISPTCHMFRLGLKKAAVGSPLDSAPEVQWLEKSRGWAAGRPRSDLVSGRPRALQIVS